MRMVNLKPNFVNTGSSIEDNWLSVTWTEMPLA
jgi:hypothetical protein